MSKLANELLHLKDLFINKKFNKIKELSKSLLIKYPESFEINLIIGTSYLANKKPNIALPLLIKANKINPASSICLLNISICYKQLKILPEYKKYLDLAYFNDPDNIEIICELGFFHLHVNEINIAISYYEKALKYKINDTKFILNLSESYLRGGYSLKVIKICLKYIQNGNVNSYVYNSLAVAYKNIGNFINAKLYLKESIKLSPHYFVAHRNLSSLIDYSINSKHLIQMESLIKIFPTDIDLNLALSKSYKDINNKSKYFSHLETANKSKKKDIKFSIDIEKNKFYKIKSIFNSFNLEYLPLRDKQLTPIFILGLPRSGTTLTENIISSHSQVYACGELDGIQNLGDQLLHNDKINIDDKNLILKFKEYYLESLPNLGDEVLYFTDKMPLNFLWIGLILKCFPHAKIINLLREPVATCWSIFNTYFPSNGNPFSYDQSDIYEYYNLYKDIMKHWNNIYSNKIYNLDYELLTINPKQEIKKLLKYCELSIEKGCFNPHLNNRNLSTASSLQARKKIYTGSSSDWKNYKEFISPKILKLI